MTVFYRKNGRLIKNRSGKRDSFWIAKFRSRNMLGNMEYEKRVEKFVGPNLSSVENILGVPAREDIVDFEVIDLEMLGKTVKKRDSEKVNEVWTQFLNSGAVRTDLRKYLPELAKIEFENGDLANYSLRRQVEGTSYNILEIVDTNLARSSAGLSFRMFFLLVKECKCIRREFRPYISEALAIQKT